MTKDLMYQDDVRELVADAYRRLDEAPGAPAAAHYDAAELEGLPEQAVAWLLGVGHPVAWAGLRPGEDVLDLGCGVGADALLAARSVAPDGRVIGVDLLPEMVHRAREAARAAGAERVEFREGAMEELPVDDGEADVVVSNGAINLSARKSRVLAEAHRALRPGGRLCASDLTIDEDALPTEVLTHPAAWAG